MEPTGPPPEPTAPTPAAEVGPLRAAVQSIQNRIISGLFVALPFVLTVWIFYWLYTWINQNVLGLGAALVRQVLFYYGIIAPDTFWWRQIISPAIAVALVLTILYCLGLFVRTRLYRVFDWVLLRVPVFTTLYKALNNLFQSLGNPAENVRFKRVVLVEFPHPGMRALAFVTNLLQDATTGQTILSVCVLTGVVPPTGFTLFVPEDQVTDVDWTVNQTLQAILSGGINAPPTLAYFAGRHAVGRGPLIDTRGHPFAPHRTEPFPPAV